MALISMLARACAFVFVCMRVRVRVRVRERVRVLLSECVVIFLCVHVSTVSAYSFLTNLFPSREMLCSISCCFSVFGIVVFLVQPFVAIPKRHVLTLGYYLFDEQIDQ